MKKRIIITAFAALAGASPAAAQSVGAGISFQGFQLDDAFGVSAANLIMLPVAVQHSITSALSMDVYTAFARGAANVNGVERTLSGLVDTKVRANYRATPWAVVTLGLNLPTGSTSKTSDEAEVASVLATELLGFREANWGLGFAATTGVVTAHEFGDWGLGMGVSYRRGSEIQPRAGAAQRYAPGDELRVRVAVDRNIGVNKLTAGLTFQNFAQDRVDGVNLFQAGNRWRGDVAYAFRAGATGALTAYGAVAWRERGDMLGDDQTISGQTLLVAGLTGTTRLGGMLLRPNLDARRIDRQDGDAGDGWLLGAGTDVPLRFGNIDAFPGGRLQFGRLNSGLEDHSILGGEVGITVRWGR
jgi:hypothetical protein